MILDASFFTGPLSVAQLGQGYVENDLIQHIQWNESEFLTAVLGSELYDEFIAGTDPEITSPEQKWLDIKNGVKFQTTTNFPGYYPYWLSNTWYLNSQRQAQWVGFAPTGNNFQSPLAGYVYFMYAESKRTQATGVGIVQPQAGAANVGVDQRKMMKAWNKMCDDIYVLWLLLAAKGSDIYSAYDATKIEYNKFKRINLFNL